MPRGLSYLHIQLDVIRCHVLCRDSWATCLQWSVSWASHNCVANTAFNQSYFYRKYDKTPWNNSSADSALWYYAELIIATQFSSVFQPPLLCHFSVFRTLPLSYNHGSTSSRPCYLCPSRSHWLPVHSRILYKVALTMFHSNTNQCPAYLSNIVIPLQSP